MLLGPIQKICRQNWNLRRSVFDSESSPPPEGFCILDGSFVKPQELLILQNFVPRLKIFEKAANLRLYSVRMSKNNDGKKNKFELRNLGKRKLFNPLMGERISGAENKRRNQDPRIAAFSKICPSTVLCLLPFSLRTNFRTSSESAAKKIKVEEIDLGKN